MDSAEVDPSLFLTELIWNHLNTISTLPSSWIRQAQLKALKQLLPLLWIILVPWDEEDLQAVVEETHLSARETLTRVDCRPAAAVGYPSPELLLKLIWNRLRAVPTIAIPWMRLTEAETF